MKNIFLNKRGQDIKVIGTLLIMLLVVGLVMFFFVNTTKGGTKVLECKTQGGRCTAGTCYFKTELPALGGKAAGCEKSEICCVPIDRDEAEPDSGCEDANSFGKECPLIGEDEGVCNVAKQCVDKCSFCEGASQYYPSDKVFAPKVESLCGRANIEKFNTKDRLYSCSCTTEDCTDSMKAEGKCIPGYCGVNTGVQTICCAK